ncbi:MAG: type 1 glutamine amidotransferase [Omnitrophica bacterium]|nr:type 1 glutamine amidotransferase [Candidatus Omnitrophota bacterium]
MVLIVKHIDIEGPGIYAEFLKNAKHETITVELARGEELPTDFERIEAVITLGGPMNVYEEEKHPFLEQELKFLRRTVKAEIPLMGICLGAQMIAKACGAKISKADNKEIGWHRVRLTDKGLKDPLFEGLGRELEVFQWHEDQFDVPEEGFLLAESDICPQAFKVGKNAYGLQFHYEVTPQMIERWIEEYDYRKDSEGRVGAQHMLIDAHKKEKEFLKIGQQVIRNFLRIIA